MKDRTIYITSFVFLLFSVLTSCSRTENLKQINPSYLEGEWDFRGKDFYRLKFKEGMCTDPLNKRLFCYYKIFSDTLQLSNEDNEILHFKILELDYYKLRIILIGRKLHTMKLAELNYNNEINILVS